jgi:hypothetical protein
MDLDFTHFPPSLAVKLVLAWHGLFGVVILPWLGGWTKVEAPRTTLISLRVMVVPSENQSNTDYLGNCGYNSTLFTDLIFEHPFRL